MVTAALWLSPVGIGSLIAVSILRACDLLGGWVGGGMHADAAAWACCMLLHVHDAFCRMRSVPSVACLVWMRVPACMGAHTHSDLRPIAGS